MISLEMFLFGLLITSALTGLTTEALKRTLTEFNKTYKSNTLAGLVAIVISVFLGVGYIVSHGIGFEPNTIVCLTAQVFMSWLCAMIGYDKVVQTISQFKNPK